MRLGGWMLWVFDGKLRRRGGKRGLARRCGQLSQPLIHCATGVPKNMKDPYRQWQRKSRSYSSGLLEQGS